MLSVSSTPLATTPTGRLSYARIGEVYGQVAAVEPWCRDAAPRADVAVMLAATIPPAPPSASKPRAKSSSRSPPPTQPTCVSPRSWR